MKIVKKPDVTDHFGQVVIGDAFQLQGDVIFMRINAAGSGFNCVNLGSGTLRYLSCTEPCIRLPNARVVIGD